MNEFEKILNVFEALEIELWCENGNELHFYDSDGVECIFKFNDDGNLI